MTDPESTENGIKLPESDSAKQFYDDSANAAAMAMRHAADAASSAAASKHHADDAADSATTAGAHATAAEAAMRGAQSAGQSEPHWFYGLVIIFLGAALLLLIVAMMIASLTGSRTISTDVVSAATLIAGGLIGILAPTPTKKK